MQLASFLVYLVTVCVTTTLTVLSTLWCLQLVRLEQCSYSIFLNPGCMEKLFAGKLGLSLLLIHFCLFNSLWELAGSWFQFFFHSGGSCPHQAGVFQFADCLFFERTLSLLRFSVFGSFCPPHSLPNKVFDFAALHSCLAILHLILSHPLYCSQYLTLDNLWSPYVEANAAAAAFLKVVFLMANHLGLCSFHRT